MFSSSIRRGKWYAPIEREANPNGWLSDKEKQSDFVCLWGFKDVIKHKILSLLFFINEWFIFQEWLIYFGLAKFVELEGEYYLDLVKVFYANLSVDNRRILSRVKVLDICIDEVVWKTFAGFHQLESSLIKVGGLKRDERLCAFMIARIILSRGGNHAQLTTKDVNLLHALCVKVPTNWISVVSDHMTKITKQQVYHLPYVVFINRILRHHGVDVSNEVTLGCSKKNTIEKLALHHMGLRKDEKEIEKYVVDQFKKQDVKLSKLQKYLSNLHRKLDRALKINESSGTSKDETDDDDNKTNEDYIDISDSE
ncbi:hypothetical protein LR48_Vigan176s001700 [Vigna angularis]|uniref:Uncharacterized protein n=1 Tax=Phaseolus angularis TaxID=3914 RepID=A0A0L9T5T2_PHAAN|nr:hypothetical protein LR48_Vigan176s001700 [Vigna angularis]